MDDLAQDEIPQQPSLQQQAIDEAKLAYSHLPHDHAVFRLCVEGKETLAEVLSVVEQKWQSHKKKKSTRLLSRLQKYTTWLQNMSAVVDVAVQTQAGVACPLWAPIKFILQISNDHSKATEQISNLLESITDSLPRLEVYQKLQSDSILQVALLNIFTDVVDFSVRAIRFFQRGTFGRLTQTVVRSFDRDIGAVIARLERHARVADQTAVATEILGASRFRKEADRRQHEELRIECERWLKPSDVKHIHLHQSQAKLNGTCEWITSNTLFKRWVQPECLTTQDRLLVISGTHGCGKSILASSIVARLEKGQQHPLFFAFSSSDGNRQTSENLIRTLLWQLLHQTDKKESVDIVHRLRSGGQPSVSELWGAFGRIVPLLAKPIYCVIDGVDECIDYNDTLFAKFNQVLNTCPSLRILLLGRSHVFQSHSGNCGFTAIDITPATLNQDIEAFITDEIAKSDILSLPEFRETVYESLKGKSEGMFLWVRLMVDDLRKSSSKSELGQRLQDLPHGLEKAYQLLFLRLSQKLDKFEQRLAQNVLAFTTTSCHPLTLVELRYAHALHCRSLETVAQPLEEYLLLKPLQAVLDVTEGLIYIADGVLRLSHSSVRDFLVRPEDRWLCELDKAVLNFRIDITKTHRTFAWLCLDYIRLETEAIRPLKLDTSYTTQVVCDRSPWLRYAILHAFYHLNRSGPPCSTTLAKVENLLKSTQIIVWVEHFAHLLFEDITLESQSQMEEFATWEDHMVDAGLDNRLLAVFEGTLKKWTGQLQQAGNYDDPLTEHLEMYFSETTDRQSGASSQERPSEATISVLDSSTARQHHQTLTTNSGQSSHDASATVSRVMDLLKGQTPLSVAHQIELCLRLSTSLRKTHVLIDPLKVLFRLILRKASCIPVFALMIIGDFYKKLEKNQEALEVFNAASEKMIHLDVPLRFRIYRRMGDCYYDLDSPMEALRSYEKAFSGYEILLGARHRDTLQTLQDIGDCYYALCLYMDALRSYEKAFSGYEILLGARHRDTLQTLQDIGDCYYALGLYMDALRSYEKAFSGYEILLGARHRDTLQTLHNIGDCYYALGLYMDALRSYEATFPGYEILYGTRHYHTLQILKRMISANHLMTQSTEVLRLSDELCIEQDFIPELDLCDNLSITRMRHTAYCHIGDHDRKAAMEKRLQATLKLIGEPHNNQDGIDPRFWLQHGCAHYILGEYDMALESFALALKAYERSQRSRFNDVSVIQAWIALTCEALRRYDEAKELYKTVYMKRHSILGPDHPDTWWTKRRLDNLMFADGEIDDHRLHDDEYNGDYDDDPEIVEDEPDNDEFLNDASDHDTRSRITEPCAQNTVPSDPCTESSEIALYDTMPGQSSEI